jgi:hypothetical protein
MLNEQPVETTLYSLNQLAPAPAQRRSSERHLSLLRVGALLVADRRELCLIRNISAGGMMIRAYSRLRPGTPVMIELKQGEPVSGKVKWAKGDAVGVSFDEAIDVIGLISSSDTGPRPRMPRVEVTSTAWIRIDATVSRTRTLNISQGGVKIVSQADIVVGAEAIVTVSGLAPIHGVVRWRDGDTYGITFNRALALPVLVAWLQDQQRQEQQRAVG